MKSLSKTFLSISLFLLSHISVAITTFSVTNNADSGAGSLRQAIQDANTTPNVGGNDIIEFSGLGAGDVTITLITDLPVIINPVTIDGYTAVSYSTGNPAIGIDGNQYGFFFNNSSASGSIIRGFAIWSCSIDGIHFDNVPDITISGCHIGLDLSGTLPASNIVGDGIQITNGASNILIGGTTTQDKNVIAGNAGHGIRIDVSSNSNVISGNHIGLAQDGTTIITNGQDGVYIDNSDDNVIGGTSTNNRNIISGNTSNGIRVINNSNRTVISSNYIGTDITGIIDKGNSDHGIYNENSDLTSIGGTSYSMRNVIAGNGSVATENEISIVTSDDLSIKGNFIGLGSDGTTNINGTDSGISLNSSNNATIGGSNDTERNVISGNLNAGIFVNTTSGTTIEGNYIGLDSTGVGALGNSGIGMSLNTCDLSFIKSNVCSNNGDHGIFGDAVTNSTLEDNIAGLDTTGVTIASNTGRGIFLQSASNNNTIRYNYLGANVSGLVLNGSSSNEIYGNYLGLAKDGVTGVGNTNFGLYFTFASSNNVVGGTTVDKRNYVSANKDHAIFLDQASSDNEFYGNYVGSDTSGLIAVANQKSGIFPLDASNNSIIGGSATGEGNLLCCSVTEEGIRVQVSTGTSIKGNLIGVDKNGNTTSGFGNGSNGIIIMSYGPPSSDNTIIGGTTEAEGNMIAGNTNDGVLLQSFANSTNFVPVRRNKIFCNGGLGINLDAAGGTVNEGIAAPNITSSGTNTVSGTGTSGNTIHIYLNTTNNDSGTSCNCEGETFIGTTTVNGAGTWSFTHSLGLTTDQTNSVTATQTNSNLSTSEFYACTTPLPVVFNYFKAHVGHDNLIHLYWETGLELNNDYFLVERSIDGINFEAIHSIDGSGNSREPILYNTIDHEMINHDIIYYRLTQVDFDGTEQESEIIAITSNRQEFSVWPNPASKEINISYFMKKGDKINVISSTGLLVKSFEIHELATNQKNINIEDLTSGIYSIELKTHDDIKYLTVIIL